MWVNRENSDKKVDKNVDIPDIKHPKQAVLFLRIKFHY